MNGDELRGWICSVLLAALGCALCGASVRGDAAAARRADVARFAARADAALAVTGAKRGDWGVLVTDADTGQVLYERNADHYFLPASDVKLFTTALALATLGPEYRIRTTIETHGTIDSSGSLRGDLVLVGRGDPKSLEPQVSI